ncbi:DUF4367 domain-containing protein [Robertmurraya kyonggiensis]|uniref:DUF4367 domain-containing protein n=1 Tax=Robertmurraya kyonggiensis TaxID=1037680 RepID=UPI001FE2CD49|nr:DUF4367 domain-containing protein [Robertmurraya kyonggiensis]
MILRILLFTLFLQIPLIAQADQRDYEHNSVTLPELKEKVDFSVLVPEKTPDDWTLEIKTYPMDAKKHFSYFRLHYYTDKTDPMRYVGIELRKWTINFKKPITPNTEEININEKRGFFTAWGNSGEFDNKGELITGGVLRWAENGTLLEMDSSRIPKEMMLEIARSMKVLK